MHSCGAHAAVAMTFVECHREEDVRRFRSAISYERFIRRALKVGIVEVHVRIAMTGGRQVDEPPSVADKQRNPVDQDKMSQVIGAELSLKPVRRLTKRRRHYAGVSDHYINGSPFFSS